MGKYDSLRKSQAPRHGAHALTPGLSYVPTVCRSVLSDDVDLSADAAAPNPAWDFACDGLDDELDEPLPVPELEEESRVAARPVVMQPIQATRAAVVPAAHMPRSTMIQPTKASRPAITQVTPKPRVQAPLDPLAMLEAATIRNVPRRR